jgi:hypothetical protein
MICYVHARDGITDIPAVSTCRNCGVGVCLEHLAEMELHKPGGVDYGCPHVLPTPSDAARWSGNSEPTR